MPDGVHPNGVYVYGGNGFPTESYESTNYWVDAVLSVVPTVDNKPPTVLGLGPSPNSTNVPVEARVTVTFSESLDLATVTANNVMLQGPGGVPVATTFNYYEDSSTKKVTLTPTAHLTSSTAYTIFVRGGASGIKDAAGNALAADVTSSFTTAPPGAPTHSLFTGNWTPEEVDSGDAQSIEVGLKFQSTNNGFVSGIRFYKSVENTGTHTAHFWSSTGQLLATATF